MTMDDFSAHKTDNIEALLWERGFIRIVLGGGTTGAIQPCDGALNQHVRRYYGNLEANSHLQKMMAGDPLPLSKEIDSMNMLHEI